MNKIKIISVIVAVFVITATIFWACSKDNQDTTFQAPNDYLEEIDIDKLMAETGIDIYALSELPAIQELSDITSKQVELAYNQVELADKGLNSSKKIAFTLEVADQIKRLTKEINAAKYKGETTGDYSTFFTVAEQLYALVGSIEGFTIITNENGFKTVEFDGEEYNLPIEQIDVARSYSFAIVEAVPQIQSFPVDVQTRVVAASIMVNMERNSFFMKAAQNPNSLEQCKADARKEHNINMALSTGAFIAEGLLCGATGYFAIICAIKVFSDYTDRSADIKKLLYARIEDCNKLYK